MRAMVSSVKDKGITNAAIVRPREGGGYEMVSGHRRMKASELAGFIDMPCIVRNLTDEQAITQMVEDNTNPVSYTHLDVYKRQAERTAIDATWKAQEDFTGEENALVVIDGSGSMYGGADPIPATVALSLGCLLYTSAAEYRSVNKP